MYIPENAKASSSFSSTTTALLTTLSPVTVHQTSQASTHDQTSIEGQSSTDSPNTKISQNSTDDPMSEEPGTYMYMFG